MQKFRSSRLHPVVGVFLGLWLTGGLFAAQATFARSPSDNETVNLTTAVEHVAQASIPAVVHIEVTQRQEVSVSSSPFENDPFFRHFFDFPRVPKKFERESKGLGTGMIIDAGGHILTNYHVVRGASKIRVVLAGGQQYVEESVKLIGTDPKTDLAVIKIAAKEALPHVTFGDSDKVKVGEWVVAIGHPRGLDETVTHGIISAKHRRGITDPNSYQDFLQTDAAINPGNSGGPLLNLRGEVIGINAAIASQSGGSEGIGFAIPSNMAAYIIKQLIDHGTVNRGWIGVVIQNLTPQLAQSFGLKTATGALIGDVVKGSPADKAGMKRGDVVVMYQGKEIADAAEFRNGLAATPIGDEVRVTVLRGGKREDLLIKVESPQEENKAMSAVLKKKLGIAVRPATANEMEKYNMRADPGVVITWVDPKGTCGQAGLEVGDMILEVNGQPIDSSEVLAASVNTLQHNQPVTILALDGRTGRTGYVQIVLP